MKAIGISIILAQSGLYVPCKKMKYYPYQHIFSRICGSDNLFKGQSSFTIEMLDLNVILNKATNRSLIIGDEICRGTETISANAIVSALIITLSERKSNFIFATHLHDLIFCKEIMDLSNLSIKHLGVDIDKDNKLNYKRNLKDGSGSHVYGLLVSKYLIKNNEFHNLTEKLASKNIERYDYLNKYLLTNKVKKSRYNKKKIVDECEKCGTSYNLHTHHKIPQKECNNEGFINHLSHLKKNQKWNLQILCELCHLKEHKHVSS